MVSTFEDIFSRFYQREQDYNLAGLEEDVAKEILNGYIKSVISKPYVRKLFSSIVVDSDVEEIEYTMRESWGDDVDQDFVEEMVALGCVVEWIRPRYHSVQNTSQMFTNKEQTYYSQANHMTELREMFNKSQNDLRKYIRDRGYTVALVNSE